MQKRNVKLICWTLLIVTILAGCRHKPAYSEIDTNKSSRNENQSAASQPNDSASAPSSPATAAPTQPVPATKPPAYKPPTFLDQVTGQIKDLPNYPQSTRVQVQMGPVGEAYTATFVISTGDSMEKIQAFYERIIKSNRWSVIDKRTDPEFSEWTLQRGEDGARVQAKKDTNTGRITILLVRGEKLQSNQ